MGRTVGAAEFKAKCLRLIEEIGRDGEPVTITKRGRPVAVLTTVATDPSSPIGILRGSVLRYDDPFKRAFDPDEWEMNR